MGDAKHGRPPPLAAYPFTASTVPEWAERSGADLLWNIPADKFGTSYEDTFVATFNYLVNADRSAFKCANGIHPLLQVNSQVSWAPANCEAYLDALRSLWNNWR